MKKDRSILPRNRLEAFFDIIHNQFSLILKLGLLILIFFLPVILILFLSNIKVYEVNLSLKEGLLTDVEALAASNGYIDARNLLFIILIPIAFIFLSGIFNIIRKITYQEGVLFGYDFKKGIKNNGLFFFLISLLLCILYFVFSNTLRTELVSHSVYCLIAVCLSFVCFIILFVFMPLLLHQTIIYNLSFFNKIKNAIIISLRMFYIFIPLAIVNLIPFLILLINNGVLLIIFICLDFLIIIPLIIVINTLITDYAFDFFINYYHFKEIYRKGLMNNAEDNVE